MRNIHWGNLHCSPNSPFKSAIAQKLAPPMLAMSNTRTLGFSTSVYVRWVVGLISQVTICFPIKIVHRPKAWSERIFTRAGTMERVWMLTVNKYYCWQCERAASVGLLPQECQVLCGLSIPAGVRNWAFCWRIASAPPLFWAHFSLCSLYTMGLLSLELMWLHVIIKSKPNLRICFTEGFFKKHRKKQKQAGPYFVPFLP